MVIFLAIPPSTLADLLFYLQLEFNVKLTSEVSSLLDRQPQTTNLLCTRL